MKGPVSLMTRVENVTLDVKEVEGVTIRKVAIKFARDFDDDVVALLGGDSKAILASLKRHGQEKAYIAIDRIVVKASLVNPDGETVDIGRLAGKQAVATASSSEQEPPAVRLEFDMFYADEVFSFLGRNAKGTVQLNLAPVVQELAFDEGKAAHG